MKVIGISGNATVGKDSLCTELKTLLEEDYNYQTCRFAFADKLKKEVDNFLLETLGISAFTQNPKEKEIIRPFLVWWGTEIRRKNDKNHWIDQIENNMKFIHSLEEAENSETIFVITDVRYKNEFDWIKSFDNGCTIFLDRYDKNMNLIQPGNEYEERNNKWLRDTADIKFVWQTVDDESYKKRFIKKNKIIEEIQTYLIKDYA